MVINTRLKELRTERRLTQKQVADAMRISSTAYAGYEQGYREPNIQTLISLCKFFEVTSDYLIGLSDI